MENGYASLYFFFNVVLLPKLPEACCFYFLKLEESLKEEKAIKG